MDDVLLSNTYAEQHMPNGITGTVGLDVDESSIIVIVGAETVYGGWTSNCFYDFIVVDWQSLSEVLESGMTVDQLFASAVHHMNSSVSDILVAYSVLEELYTTESLPNGIDQADIQAIIEQTIVEMMATAPAVETVNELVTQISIMEALTANPDLVTLALIETIALVYIPEMLEDIQEIVANETTIEDAEIIQTIGEITTNVAENLITAFTDPMSTATASERQNLTTLLIDTTQNIMHFTLQQAWLNETLEHLHSDNCSKTKGAVRSTNWTACGYDEGVQLLMPSEWVIDGDVTEFECVITTYCEPMYIVVDNRTQNVTNLNSSHAVTNQSAINLYGHNTTGTIYNTTSSCAPYLIIFDINDDNREFFQVVADGDWTTTNNSFKHPVCQYFDTDGNKWDGEGCVVADVTNVTVTCACTHLTTFRVITNEIDPKANTLVLSDFRELKPENIQNYPTTWVTMLMVVVVLGVACICVPNTSADKPIIAFEDIIYKDFRDQYLHKHQQWHEIHQIDR
jgi:hypothetical protein